MVAQTTTTLPSAPIGLVPQGLLGLLQLKQQGKNPDQLLSTVAPTLELLQFYLQRIQLTELGLFGAVPATAAIATGGHGTSPFLVGGVTVQVPNNELWYIDQCSAANNTIPAADSVSAAVLMSSSTGGSTLLTPVYADVISARVRSWITPPMIRPVWAYPGSLFFLLVFDIVTAGGLSFTLNMRGSRLPV